ncbi:SDR family NAD(P)-dependent oxidoreductase [Kibdelosporangium aridum]|uniref:SDR family NAD(P)-dependent oxidoreductase n=1 Tax=Kibdelosporangium aridum TaxID=2030 RepID=A0A428XWF8_KIBAR|nr:SDR family oxidoreductase [Kibdelosporangium aridum]RSM59665.1 SDR family NAD(P)-dependent oxidoreductase [Kibdelosporangium aridum]
MILVTGATGTIGSHLVPLLAESGADVRAMSRRQGFDFEDAESLKRAVDGVDTVFLLSAPGKTAEHDLALLEVAQHVRKVVKISAIHTGEPGFELTSSWHLPGEQALRSSDLMWTILRPTTFASNALAWLPQIQAGEPVPSYYGDGTNGVVDPRDIAAVAAKALLTDDHDNQTYTLTGPELLSTAQQVDILSEVLGKPLTTMDISPEQARTSMLAQGMSPDSVDFMLKGFEIVRNGGNAVVTDHVEHVLGRPPATFRNWAQDTLNTLTAKS